MCISVVSPPFRGFAFLGVRVRDARRNAKLACRMSLLKHFIYDLPKQQKTMQECILKKIKTFRLKVPELMHSSARNVIM